MDHTGHGKLAFATFGVGLKVFEHQALSVHRRELEQCCGAVVVVGDGAEHLGFVFAVDVDCAAGRDVDILQNGTDALRPFGVQAHEPNAVAVVQDRPASVLVGVEGGDVAEPETVRTVLAEVQKEVLGDQIRVIGIGKGFVVDLGLGASERLPRRRRGAAALRQGGQAEEQDPYGSSSANSRQSFEC